MLSLAGVSASQGTFYFEKEDYYFRGGEGEVIAGQYFWGTQDRIDHERFQEIVSARIEETGGALNGKDRVADNLSFSAPKSVSLVAALDKEMRDAIIEAHREAVKAVVDYIESSGMFQARDEKGNPTEAKGMLAVRFDHFTNRNGDPQLHSHVLIANVAERAEDGKIVSAYLRELYTNKVALGTMYRMELAFRMERLGYQVDWKRDGTFELKGFTKEQLRTFSTRRAEIEDYLKEQGFEGGKAAELAALRTRDPKKDFDPEELRRDWEARARVAGIELPDPGRERPSPVQDIAALKLTQNVLTEVAEKELLTRGFTQDVRVQLEGVKALAQEGVYVPVHALKWASEKALGRTFEALGGKQYLDTDHVGRIRYTTANSLHAELRTREIGLKGTRHPMDPEKAKEALLRYDTRIRMEKGYGLSDEQRQAIEGIATGARDAVVVGKAGTGKTTMLEGLKEVYQAQGRAVIGVSVSGAAAANLEKETGLRSFTVDALNFQKGAKLGNLRGGVLVVDEAGMMDARRTAAVQEFARKHDMQVIYVGDPDQLKPVGAGDPFGRLAAEAAEKGSFYELSKIYRQKDPGYRKAAHLASRGETVKALEKLEDKGWVREIRTKKERLDAAKRDYLEAVRRGKSVLVVTDRNSVKDRLNREIRYEMKEQGYVAEKGLTAEVRGTNGKSLGQREFASGDRVVFLKNDRNLGVQNGLAGTVVSVDRKARTLTVETSQGLKKVDLKEYNYLDHGYAVTVHKSQGQTVDRVVYVAESKSRLASANSFYVAITRGREEARIYTDSIEGLKAKIEVSQEKTDVLTWAAEKRSGAFTPEERARVREDLSRDVSALREPSGSGQTPDLKVVDKVVNLKDYREYSAREDLKEETLRAVKRETANQMLREELQGRKSGPERDARDKAIETRCADWHPETAREDLREEIERREVGREAGPETDRTPEREGVRFSRDLDIEIPDEKSKGLDIEPVGERDHGREEHRDKAEGFEIGLFNIRLSYDRF